MDLANFSKHFYPKYLSQITNADYRINTWLDEKLLNNEQSSIHLTNLYMF